MASLKTHDKIFYLHVPKTGGTSVTRAMNISRPLKDIHGNHLPFPSDHLTLDERSVLGAHDVTADHDLLCTVREPLARFVSLAGHYDVSFNELIKKITDPGLNPNDVFDGHVSKGVYQTTRPQTDYTHPVAAGGSSPCTYIVTTDELDSALPGILREYGYKFDTVPRLNVNNGNKRYWKRNPTVADVTEEHKAFVHDFYARDYDLLAPIFSWET